MASRFVRVIWVYFVAGVVAVFAGIATPSDDPLVVAAVADVAATLVVFAASVYHDNSSFYDAYWSVVPIPLAGYWYVAAANPEANGLRIALSLGLVSIWAVRLTYNWARSWPALDHEDWRYQDLRTLSGKAYWLVSFLGIQMFPTVLVFLGCLPLYAVITAGSAPLGVLDALAFAVTAGAIWIEAASDQELRAFVTNRRDSSELLSTGLWSRCRHPNYFGEVSFWWGLYLFGLAADPGFHWSLAGPVGITVLFRFISLPMIENRMLERKPAFAAHRDASSMLIPRLRRPG